MVANTLVTHKVNDGMFAPRLFGSSRAQLANLASGLVSCEQCMPACSNPPCSVMRCTMGPQQAWHVQHSFIPHTRLQVAPVTV